MKILSEPRDNADIFPPCGNLHKSSYRRLGPEDEVTGISETRAMLSQIDLKDEYKSVTCPRRSLLTMQSLASAEYVSLTLTFQKYYKQIICIKFRKNKICIFGIKKEIIRIY